ncbi:MAG: GIY-YIG nuclease family protein [Methylovulum miyakonense]|uniref:GIY-YIG nuclease family protein n=1 Tax=Methylovulum miyakonense TaxID=645578 RepID=UPI003BB71A81
MSKKNSTQTAGVIAEIDSISSSLPDVSTTDLPFETEELRKGLAAFLDKKIEVDLGSTKKIVRLGAIKWGVYAFYDYDGEPIYVGQTKEKLGTRIRRHLTNQRTDAVAMNVLDPFEVHSIRVWPLPEFEATSGKDVNAVEHLNALEYYVFQALLEESKFKAVLNEKDPPPPKTEVPFPASYTDKVVSDAVSKLRDHPDLRIARRALTLAKLAQVISERKVQKGLRRTLLAQAKRLQALAQSRYEHAAENGEEDGDEKD